MSQYQMQGPDYLTLHQFFQSRADEIKASLFASITWVLGYAAAVLAFILTTLVDFSKPLQFNQPGLGVMLSIIGLILCAYALVLIYDGANHIRGNWRRAELCLVHVVGMKELILGPSGQGARIKVWTQMAIVVSMFCISFAGLAAVFAANI